MPESLFSKVAGLRLTTLHNVLNDLFYFLYCNVCNFADGTTSSVCDKNLQFILTKLENHSNIMILNDLKIII